MHQHQANTNRQWGQFDYQSKTKTYELLTKPVSHSH